MNENKSNTIDTKYEKYYLQRNPEKVYPTEFVVRTFLSEYPNLNFKPPTKGSSILDVGFGDGRNTIFLCDLGLNVSGIEISQKIVDLTKERVEKHGYRSDLRVGKNGEIPFSSNRFDYILACHSCYYCDGNETLLDNLREYSRVLKKDGFLIASVPNRSSYIFEGAKELPDGSMIVMNDPYNNRNGYRLHAFASTLDVERYFSPLFTNFSFGSADNNYYGIYERLFWVVCQKL